MRSITLVVLAILAVPTMALAQGGQCAAGSQVLFRQARSPYKIAKIKDTRAVRPGEPLVITSTSDQDMTCGQADKGIGCEVAGPAIVKIERLGDVAFFDVPTGRKAAVMGPSPMACELE